MQLQPLLPPLAQPAATYACLAIHHTRPSTSLAWAALSGRNAATVSCHCQERKVTIWHSRSTLTVLISSAAPPARVYMQETHATLNTTNSDLLASLHASLQALPGSYSYTSRQHILQAVPCNQLPCCCAECLPTLLLLLLGAAAATAAGQVASITDSHSSELSCSCEPTNNSVNGSLHPKQNDPAAQ